MALFRDRIDAGRKLAALLKKLSGEDVIVLALPRGGVPVAAEIARSLGAPLDVVLPRKLGAPGDPELALGAVAEDGTVVIDQQLAALVGASGSYIEQAVARESREIERRSRLYRGRRPAPDVRGKTVVVVDDGMATGYTMLAAVRGLEKAGAGRVIVAVPVASHDSVARLSREADEVVVLDAPEVFWAVGQFYESFPQMTDEEVLKILGRPGTDV